MAENIAKSLALKQKKTLAGIKISRITKQKNLSLENTEGLLFDSFSVAETFKKYYSSLAGNLVLKLPKPPNNFGMGSVNKHYAKHNSKEKLIFANIQSDKVFRILKNFDETKASGIDDLSGIFLKDGAIIQSINFF